MQQIVIAKPYRFVPPRRGTLVPRLLQQSLSFYPAGYFTPAPTPERLFETVARFEEDMTYDVPPLPRLRAVVDVGEAIVMDPERRRGGEGDPLMGQLRERLESLLAALEEARPGARMA